MRKLVFSVLFVLIGLGCTNSETVFVTSIDNERFNNGVQYSWLTLEPMKFYTLTVFNSGRVVLKTSQYDSNFNETSEEKDNVSVGTILRTHGLVTSIIVNGKTYKVFDELLPVRNIDGFFDIKWGENYLSVLNKLRENGHEVNIVFENEYLELNVEYLGVAGEMYLIFRNYEFCRGGIRYNDKKTESDYLKLVNDITFRHGVPDYSEARINAWFFDGGDYSISTMFIRNAYTTLEYTDNTRFNEEG
jgi:hypothetical protein